jgi:hypothetical protein
MVLMAIEFLAFDDQLVADFAAHEEDGNFATSSWPNCT